MIQTTLPYEWGSKHYDLYRRNMPQTLVQLDSM
jgi:hypothetical protein